MKNSVLKNKYSSFEKESGDLSKYPICVNDYINGWKFRKAVLVANSFADDGEMIDDPHPIIPKQEIEDFLETIAWKNFPDMTYFVKNVVGEKNIYCIDWVMVVSNPGLVKKSLAGQKIYIPMVDILKVDQGKVKSSFTYFDRKKLWDSVLGI
jgi:hypothetical protein